jgi:hypothetical protein
MPLSWCEECEARCVYIVCVHRRRRKQPFVNWTHSTHKVCAFALSICLFHFAAIVASEGSGRISATPSVGSIDGSSRSASVPGDSNGRIDVAMNYMSSINASALDVVSRGGDRVRRSCMVLWYVRRAVVGPCIMATCEARRKRENR